MKKMSKKLSVPAMFFVLLALAALALLGATAEAPQHNDLTRTAWQLAGESSENIRNASRQIAFKNPGAILRANVIKNSR